MSAKFHSILALLLLAIVAMAGQLQACDCGRFAGSSSSTGGSTCEAMARAEDGAASRMDASVQGGTSELRCYCGSLCSGSCGCGCRKQSKHVPQAQSALDEVLKAKGLLWLGRVLLEGLQQPVLRIHATGHHLEKVHDLHADGPPTASSLRAGSRAVSSLREAGFALRLRARVIEISVLRI